ncbi:MAG: prepilin-type N-terminal cleavage/methylation domain-containing protein [Lentisphaeria bacterium]|nr:prepilin-type N-terminal cleavage/methylation domain-containing protein [Lentisphaeria bacterium]
MKKSYRFTLVELLAVMALISILSAIGFGVYSYAKNKSKESASEALLGQITAGLESFNAKHHRYPSSGGSFQPVKFTFGNSDGTLSKIDFGSEVLTLHTGSLTKKQRMENELIESFAKAVDIQTLKNNLTPPDSNGVCELVDAWGGKIYYRSPGKFKTGSYDLISAGPDGGFGTGGASTPPNGNDDLDKFRNSAGEKVCDDLFNF